MIELYILLCSNEYGNVFYHFWHSAEGFPQRDAVEALAKRAGWMQPNDKLEWQRANQRSHYLP